MSTLSLRHPELIALYRLWLDQCDDDTLPSSADVNPKTLLRWLDNMVVIDTPRSGELRYAYYGDNLSAAFGADMVGSDINSLPEQQRAILNDEYRRIQDDRLPRSRCYTAVFSGMVQTWERLSLPFFDTEGEVEKILVAAYRVS